MAYEADRVVVELLAQNDQFDAATKASAANFSKSMGDIQSSGAAAEKGVGQFSSALKENRLTMNQSRIGMMEFQHIARGVSDQMAAGAPPIQIFTQHLGMMSEAVALSGGAFGKLGGFLMGPWGIALTLATVVGGKLLEHFLTEKDTLDSVYEKLLKHKEQTELSAQAEDIWSHSLDGLLERSGKLNSSLEKRLQTQTALQHLTMAAAQEQFDAATIAADKLQADPHATQEQLDKAEVVVRATAIALHNTQMVAGQVAGEAIASITKAAEAWADQQKQAIEVLQTAHPELAEKPVADQMSAAYVTLKDAVEQAAAANLDFNDTVKATNLLNNQLATGAISVATYDQKIQSLAKSLRDAAEAAKSAPHAIEQFKQSVIGAEGTGPNRLGSSASGYGQFMPSTFEGYFKQLYPQQAAGMSNPEIDALRNNRQVATAVIDAATKDYVSVLQHAGQSITAAGLYTVHLLGAGDARKLFSAPAGESTSNFLSAGVLKGNPFLRGTAGDARAAIGKRIGDSSGAVSSGAAAIAQAQEQEAKKAAEQQAAFTSAMDQLNADLINARKGQVKDELTQLHIQEDEVRAELQKRDDAYQSAVSTGKLTQVQADLLKDQAAQVAAAKLASLDLDQQNEIAKRRNDVEQQSLGFAEDALKAQDAAATSQAQHRELQLEILDIVYQQKLEQLQYQKMLAERNGQFDQAGLIQGQINNIPAQKASERAGVIRGTMDPLESWLHNVPHDAHAVTEALQGIATNGFDQIASSIAGVVTGTQTLGQAFRSISQQVVGDIIQMTVRMLIFRALSSALGLGGGDINPSIGSLNIPTPTLPEFGPASAIDIPGLAGGGFGVIGGAGGTDNNLLSLNGQPIAWVSQGEGLAISPSNARAASPFGSSPSVVMIGVQANDYFDAQVLKVSGPVIAQAATRAAQGGAALARQNLARSAIHRLG